VFRGSRFKGSGFKVQWFRVQRFKVQNSEAQNSLQGSPPKRPELIVKEASELIMIKRFFGLKITSSE
jgi:hypothetical protein